MRGLKKYIEKNFMQSFNRINGRIDSFFILPFSFGTRKSGEWVWCVRASFYLVLLKLRIKFHNHYLFNPFDGYVTWCTSPSKEVLHSNECKRKDKKGLTKISYVV